MKRSVFGAEINQSMKKRGKEFAELREHATEFFFPRIYDSNMYQNYLKKNYARHNERINKANKELLEAQIANR